MVGMPGKRNMADLDEMSLMLGRIDANMQNAVAWMDKHEKKDQERFDMLADRLDAMAGHQTRIEAVEMEIVPIKAHIELAKIREYKLAGALVVIGGMVSLVGTVLFALWRNVTSVFG